MVTVKRIRTLPENFGEFVQEIASGIGAIYGAPAADSYRRNAARQIQLGMRQLGVSYYGAFDGIDAAGIASCLIRGSHGYVSFVHVLSRYANQDVETRLIRDAVQNLQAAGVRAIVAENVDFSRLQLDAVYAQLGFDRVDRQLMKAPASALAPGAGAGPASLACTGSMYNEAAAVIHAAYLDQSGRDLHPEVHSIEGTREFVRLAATGSFGSCYPSYVRVVRRQGHAIAAIVGCEAAPAIGFILQVAVDPAYRRTGLATALIRDLAAEFDCRGLSDIVLGVTLSNPARGLYEKIGFTRLQPVTAYIWWKRPAAVAKPGAVRVSAEIGEQA